jgi:hypothetical protein
VPLVFEGTGDFYYHRCPDRRLWHVWETVGSAAGVELCDHSAVLRLGSELADAGSHCAVSAGS